jgi:4-diphosphocytidyl-2C-methyl-D-erythritol kinase
VVTDKNDNYSAHNQLKRFIFIKLYIEVSSILSLITWGDSIKLNKQTTTTNQKASGETKLKIKQTYLVYKWSQLFYAKHLKLRGENIT